jgi:LmbE family N-acetylglucosaminyl deacetylase
MTMLRHWLCRTYRQHLYRTAQRCDPASPVFRRPTLVFAPHQDDETLGCGGAIIKKRQADAAVKLVFIGDGSTSHSHLMPPHKLSALRLREASAAGHILGLAEDDILFLNFPEAGLRAQFATICSEVLALIRRYQPDEVYIPYARDVNEDHLVTNQAVQQAIRINQKPVTVYEYPVWAWFHWPWVGLLSGIRRPSRRVVRDTLGTWFGLRLLRDLNCTLYIGDVLAQKRTALEQHRSQMARLIPNNDWLTLHDVSGGAWLACFFQEYELFRSYDLCADQCGSSPHWSKSH